MTERQNAPRRPASAAPRRAAPPSAALRRATPAGAARRGPAPRGTAGRGALAPQRRYGLIKWGLLAALLAYAILVVGANSARNVDFSVVAGRMAAVPGLENLRAADENAFQERLDTAPEGCEGWLLYGADDIMDVSELLVAKGDDAALDRLEDAVARRLEDQLSVFRSYGVEQKGLLEGATVLRRGSWLFYAVGEYAEQWEDAFLSCIR